MVYVLLTVHLDISL